MGALDLVVAGLEEIEGDAIDQRVTQATTVMRMITATTNTRTIPMGIHRVMIEDMIRMVALNLDRVNGTRLLVIDQIHMHPECPQQEEVVTHLETDPQCHPDPEMDSVHHPETVLDLREVGLEVPEIVLVHLRSETMATRDPLETEEDPLRKEDEADIEILHAHCG